MIRSVLNAKWSFLVAFSVALVMLPGLVAEIVARAETWFPVNTEWTPTRVWVDGDDKWVEGTMVRRRCACVYVPPVRARGINGQHFETKSFSPTSASSWKCDSQPQRFGPWQIVGAARARVEVYQEHRCHSFGPTFTVLGVLP
jgi:hypothetical protein